VLKRFSKVKQENKSDFVILAVYALLMEQELGL
jgi:hypothetical protein